MLPVRFGMGGAGLAIWPCILKMDIFEGAEILLFLPSGAAEMGLFSWGLGFLFVRVPALVAVFGVFKV